jgi:hypothetical protein
MFFLVSELFVKRSCHFCIPTFLFLSTDFGLHGDVAQPLTLLELRKPVEIGAPDTLSVSVLV